MIQTNPSMENPSIINPFNKEVRLQPGVSFVDFNNQQTENNSYKPALI